MQNRQVRLPGTDGRLVLLCHHADDLSDVAEIVSHPGREQLLERHAPELRVFARQIQVRRRQIERAKVSEVARARRSANRSSNSIKVRSLLAPRWRTRSNGTKRRTGASLRMTRA